MRAAAALVMLFSLLPATPAASAESFLSVKGFVISRSEAVLLVRNGDGVKMRVLLTSRTVVSGARPSAAAIALNDLVRAEGVAAPDHGVQASRVDVVITAEGIALARGRENMVTSVLWNWLKNGSLSIPLP